jgi:toxin ParE1/3/4
MGNGSRASSPAVEVVFTVAAAADITWVRSYIGRFNPGAARRIAERLKSAAQGLAEYPEIGRLRPDGTRELVAVTPYVIVYDVGPDRVTILRVWHGAQDRL